MRRRRAPEHAQARWRRRNGNRPELLVRLGVLGVVCRLHFLQRLVQLHALDAAALQSQCQNANGQTAAPPHRTGVCACALSGRTSSAAALPTSTTAAATTSARVRRRIAQSDDVLFVVHVLYSAETAADALRAEDMLARTTSVRSPRSGGSMRMSAQPAGRSGADTPGPDICLSVRRPAGAEGESDEPAQDITVTWDQSLQDVLDEMEKVYDKRYALQVRVRRPARRGRAALRRRPSRSPAR